MRAVSVAGLGPVGASPIATVVMVLLPFASLVTIVDAAHPTLVLLVPHPLVLGLVGVTLCSWAALVGRELLAGRLPQGPYRIALGCGAVVTLGSLLGFDPLAGTIAGVLFTSLTIVGSAIDREAARGGAPQLLRAALITGIVLCLVALVALALRRPAGVYAFAHGRAIGTFTNPNELAEYALCVCAISAATILGRGRDVVLGWCALALGVLTLAATASRSGALAFAIGSMVLAALLARRRRLVVVALALVAFAAGVALLDVDQRHNPADSDARVAAWREGLRTIAAFPLLGVGIGGYRLTQPAMRDPGDPGGDAPIAFDPHNFALSFAAETGVLGAGMMAWVIARFAREQRRLLRTATPANRRLSLALVAGVIATACHLMFNAFAVTIALWLPLMAIATGVARILE